MLLSSLKSQLSSLSDEQLNTLRNMFLFRRRDRWLRSNGWLNLILGVFTLWLGSAVLWEFSLFRLIQFMFGILIIGQSLWMIWHPNTLSILSFGVILLLAGGWNIFLWINSDFASLGMLGGIFGLFQLWWAYGAFAQYRFYGQLIPIKPSPEIGLFYDEAWRQISQETLKNEPDTIQLWVAQFKWRGLLLENFAAFAINSGKLLIILRKNDVQFEMRGRNAANKRRVYGRIKLLDTLERAMMNKSSFQKYAEWKGLETLIAQSSPSYWERLPRVVRIILCGIVAFFILYVLFLIAVVIQYS